MTHQKLSKRELFLKKRRNSQVLHYHKRKEMVFPKLLEKQRAGGQQKEVVSNSSNEEFKKVLNKDHNYIATLLEEDTKDLNETSRELSRQLNLTATVLISFSAIFFASDSIAKSLIPLQKVLIFSSWIALIISIALGIGQFYTDLQFFIRGVTLKQAALDEIADSKIKTEQDRDSLYEEFKYSILLFSRHICTLSQMIFLFGGASALLVSLGIQILK